MRPESTSVTLRRDLSEVAQEFDAERAVTMFIGPRVAPIFPVGEQTGNFPILNRESFKKPAKTDRKEGAGYTRITGEFGQGTFSCDEHGLEYPLDDRRVKRYRTFIDAEQAATRILRYQILMAWERRVAALTLNSASFTTNLSAVAWSDTAKALPLNYLLTGMETLEDNTGLPRSELSLVIPRAEMRELLATAQVVAKIQYTYPGVQPALLSPALVAAMLGIREVLVCGGAYDSKEEGVAETMTQIWTAGVCMLAYLAREGDPLEMPCVARTMLWTADSPVLPVMESYRDEPVRSDIVRMRDDTDEILICEADLAAYKLSSDAA